MDILLDGSVEATDDKTITWTLSKPFPPHLEVLAKQSAVPPFIMPERVAQTPPSEPITEYVGSDPFVFLSEECEPGVRVVYEKFDGYAARGRAELYGRRQGSQCRARRMGDDAPRADRHQRSYRGRN